MFVRWHYWLVGQWVCSTRSSQAHLSKAAPSQFYNKQLLTRLGSDWLSMEEDRTQVRQFSCINQLQPASLPQSKLIKSSIHQQGDTFSPQLRHWSTVTTNTTNLWVFILHSEDERMLNLFPPPARVTPPRQSRLPAPTICPDLGPQVSLSTSQH